MPKITKVNIAAARAQRDILRRNGKEIPEMVERLASLPFDSASADARQSKSSERIDNGKISRIRRHGAQHGGTKLAGR